MFVRLSALAVALLAGGALTGCASNQENPGPCPRAYALYDVARSVQFVNDGENLSNVGFTAEIQDVSTLCRYSSDKPIIADLELEIGFGRGPAATGDTHEYRYFVAVTRRDSAVIAKETFPIRVRFPKGQDRVYRRETVERIVIPRAADHVSGSNFEIIVGLEVSPEELEFNRDGKRFTTLAGS